MNFKPWCVVLSCMLAAISVNSQCTISETDNSLVAIFTKIFMYAIATYQPWDVVFNVDTPADEAAQIYYDIVYNAGVVYGKSEKESVEVATDIASGINETFANMTSCGFGEAYGIASATNLMTYFSLTNDNAVYIAWLFANITRDCMMSEEFETNYQCLATSLVLINDPAALLSDRFFHLLGVIFNNALYQVYNALIGM